MPIKRQTKNNKGFTLLEVTVGVAIFSVLMIMLTDVFKTVLEGQQSAVAAQNLQETFRYTFEVMSKEVRTASSSKDFCEIPSGTSAVNVVYNRDSATAAIKGHPVDGDILYFRNQKIGFPNECVYYFLSNGTLGVVRSDIDPVNGTTVYFASTTPDEIRVTDFNFEIYDNPLAPPYPDYWSQPRVTIYIKAEMKQGKAKLMKPMELQTTISSRNYFTN